MRMKFIILITIVVMLGTLFLLVFSTEPKIFEVYITPENPQVGDMVTVHTKLQISYLDIVKLYYNSYYTGEGIGSGGGSQSMEFDSESGEYTYSFLNHVLRDGTDVDFKVVIDGLFGFGKKIESDEYSFRISSKEDIGASLLSVTNFYHMPENPTVNDMVKFQATIQNNTELLLVTYAYETIKGSTRSSGSGSMQITENGEYSSNPYGRIDRPKFLSGTQITYKIVVKDITGNLVKSEEKTFNVQ